RLDGQGQPVAWWHRIVGPGILIQKGRAKAGTIDPAAVSGAADLPYDVPNIEIEWKEKDFGVPVGFWRSVGASQNTFIPQSFADNPDQIRAQMEGGAVYALTAALYGQITVDKGRVVQGNFNDYPMLRIGEAPVVETHIVDSSEAPGGLGEPGVPTVAPAVCNALFLLTGKRVRSLPIRAEDLKKA